MEPGDWVALGGGIVGALTLAWTIWWAMSRERRHRARLQVQAVDTDEDRAFILVVTNQGKDPVTISAARLGTHYRHRLAFWRQTFVSTVDFESDDLPTTIAPGEGQAMKASLPDKLGLGGWLLLVNSDRVMMQLSDGTQIRCPIPELEEA